MYLVIRGGAIGDFVLTLPVLAALRERFPKAELEILGYPRIAAMAVDAGLVRAVHALESPGLTGISLLRTVRSIWSGASSLLDTPSPFLIFTIPITSLKKTSNLAESASSSRPGIGCDETKAIHASEVFLKPLEQLTILTVTPLPDLRLIPGGQAELSCHSPRQWERQQELAEENWRELSNTCSRKRHFNLC